MKQLPGKTCMIWRDEKLDFTKMHEADYIVAIHPLNETCESEVKLVILKDRSGKLPRELIINGQTTISQVHELLYNEAFPDVPADAYGKHAAEVMREELTQACLQAWEASKDPIIKPVVIAVKVQRHNQSVPEGVNGSRRDQLRKT